ncbi:MAG: HD domain-containing protein [Thermoguttaceae bacterium]|jgi:HD superfamily phosphohydrolase
MGDHTFSDPIHTAIRLTAEEHELVATRAFRRLRRVHQLAMMHMVYPGATHSRLEHSLGVMELATRIFDIITDPANVLDEVRAALPELSDPQQCGYWRCVLRVAALCHDLGHLPFSHAAERTMLPPGWNHEGLTRAVILGEDVGGVIDGIGLRRLDVAKLAVGPREAPELRFSAWERILSQIIVADAFGADRIDYLLRDPCRAGVRCPGFDHLRLIAALRILPPPPQSSDRGAEQAAAGQEPAGNAGDPRTPREPSLGMLDVGLRPAESLVRARHFLFARIFHQHALCAYDLHFADFLRDWLPQGKYPVGVPEHLKTNDDHVAAACNEAAEDARAAGYEAARCIVRRAPFQLLYHGRPGSLRPRYSAARAIYEAARRHFGPAGVRWTVRTVRSGWLQFPVRMKHGAIALSTAVSPCLARPPAARAEYVFVAPKWRDRARRWLTARDQATVKRNEDHYQAV